MLGKVVQAAEVLQGLITVTRFLDEAQMKRAEDILVECASEASFRVNEELFGKGNSLPESECNNKPTVEKPTADTWGQHLGNLKHAAAFICVQERLAKEFPNNFSIEPRYRKDELTKEVLLTDRWLNSLVPDVVIHFTRNATRIQCIYDFKFPCILSRRSNPLDDPDVFKQLKSYQTLARGCPPAVITPGLGLTRLPP